MRKIILAILSICFSVHVLGQKWKLTRYEAMYGIGASNYFGDIGGTTTSSNWYGIKDISVRSIRPSAMVGARYKITQQTSVKLNLNLIMFGATDKSGTNLQRNYSFNAYGLEHSLQYEYSILREDRRRSSFALFNRRGMLNSYSKIGIYVFGGFGGLVNYPTISKDSIYDKKHEIFKEHFLYTGVLLGGIAAKMVYSNNMAFSIELGARYALSDFIDGFSSTYSKFNDIYYFGSFNIIYRIKTSRKGYPIIFRRY